MMRQWLAAFALVASCAQIAPVAPGFDFDRTLRVDYFHSGGPAGEVLKLDGVSREGEWPGSRTQLLDPTDLGKYNFDVVDAASNRVLYSRGFASTYGEWETTPEYKRRNRTFHESLRFPWPAAPVRVTVRKRDGHNVFQPLWDVTIDPGSLAAGAPRPAVRPGASDTRLSTILEGGPPSRTVDLLLISHGYSASQASRFHRDATRLIDALFALEPFKSRRRDFSVRALHVPGSRLAVEFNVFGLERYALSTNNRALRDAAGTAPYDLIEILMNETRYGGGGIFNQQSTVAASNTSSEYVFIHELAHNLAGVADEYVGNVTYETGAAIKAEPWEPNVTALHDPSMLKWRDLVEPGTPLPTPMSLAGKVGAFEGAAYEARGLYRPEAECIMGSRAVTNFCRVCQRAISRIIDLHVN